MTEGEKNSAAPMIGGAIDAKGELQHRRERQRNSLADALRGRECFVVMPFGQKQVLAADQANTISPQFQTVDFDAVYNHLIEPCLQAEGFTAKRSDQETDAGLIHQQMIQRIIDSDLVLVDVSSWNANVFYELGIRHTARKSGTLILHRKGENLPFNIAGMRAFDYPAYRNADEWTKDTDSLEDARDQLREALIATLRPGLPDSPVHTLVPGLNISRPAKPLTYRFAKECKLDGFIERNLSGSSQSIPDGKERQTAKELQQAAASKRIGVIEGDLSRIDFVDAWVNPENTRFEMARAHDHSISAIIRSQAVNKGDISRFWRGDVLARRLKREAERVGGEVETGAAVALPPYRLRQQNNLVAIVHVAAQTGMRGRGYQTTRNLEDCVENALDAVERWNRSPWRYLRVRQPIRSIVFPLFGSASREWEPEWVAERLIGAAAQYLTLWPTEMLEKVYFLAYTDHDRAVCRSAFIRLGLTVPKAADDEPGHATRLQNKSANSG
jgi:hypothetical protein